MRKAEEREQILHTWTRGPRDDVLKPDRAVVCAAGTEATQKNGKHAQSPWIGAGGLARGSNGPSLRGGWNEQLKIR